MWKWTVDEGVSGWAAELLDGTVISLRALRPDDAADVVDLYDSLTDEERYFRFLTMHPAHLADWAKSLTQSKAGQYSIGAFQAGKLLGVANYVACLTPDDAEVAVVVAHSEHLRGVGTALLRRLGQIAKDNGIHRFVADVLWENHLMLQVLGDAEWPSVRRLDGSVLHVTVDLKADTP